MHRKLAEIYTIIGNFIHLCRGDVKGWWEAIKWQVVVGIFKVTDPNIGYIAFRNT